MERREFLWRSGSVAGAATLMGAGLGCADATGDQPAPVPDPTAVTRGPATVATLNVTVVNPPESCSPGNNPDYKQAIQEYKQGRMAYHEKAFQRAAEQGADIVCASEDTFRIAGARVLYPDHADEVTSALSEPIPGPVTDWMGEIARRHEIYIAFPFMEDGSDGNLYNSVALVNRQGKLMGAYRKSHPVTGEKEYVTPGDDYPVFDTDFGRVGFMICWDMMFPEVVNIYGLEGVDLILWPSASIGINDDLGLATLRVRASDHSLAIAGSVYNRKNSAHSCVVDQDGNILVDVEHQDDALAIAELDFGTKREGNWRERTLRDRRPETYGLITDPNPPVQKLV